MTGPLRVASIDIGSNALRLLVAEARSPTDWTRLHRERAPVRLGHHTFLQGCLDPQATDHAVEALAGFAATCQQLGVHRVRAVATSAVREADDGRDFVKRVRKKTGLRVEAIDGAEEARLVHRAVRERVPLGERPWMLMDLGGGSLELALVDRQRIHWAESRRIGTVRLLETYDQGDPVEMANRIHEHIDSFQFLHHADALDLDGLAATGGNINALAGLLGQSVRDGKPGRISLDDLEHLRRELEAMTLEERMEAHGFRPDRADVIVPAAMDYERVARLAGATHIHVPGWGLREGVLLDQLDRHYQPDLRRTELELTVEEAALRLGRTFRFDEPHGAHVADLALRVFDATASLHGFDAKERRVLHAAALLHDVGKCITDKGHHKHSQYLIDNAELLGLRRREHHLCAMVARYHRKALPQAHHKGYRLLKRKDVNRLHGLSAILRVADGLDKRHLQAVTDVSVDVQKTGTTIQVDGRGDLALETWAATKKADLWAKHFGPVTVQRRQA